MTLRNTSEESSLMKSRPMKEAGKTLADATDSRKPLSRPRRWVFRLIAFSLPLIFLAAIEGVLRLFGCGVPTAFAFKREVAGRTMFVNNPRFTWQFFGPNLARYGEPFALATKKPAKTCRIFVLGESAAQGFPEPAFGMSTALEVMLRHRYPDVDFEVINVAITAINSHVVLPISKECSAMDADLMVVYLGNNEVVGPYGGGTIFSPLLASHGMIRSALALRSLRVFQLAASPFEQRQGPHVWRGLAMFLDHQVRLSDDALTKTYDHFECNLLAIRRTAVREGVPLVLSTIGVNLKDCAPFASLHTANLSESDLKRWDQSYQQGIVHETAHYWTQAIAAYEAAKKIDDAYAELHFRLARCQLGLGEYNRALGSFSKARDLDTLRFRADSRINEIIRKIAAEGTSEGILLADAAARLAAAEPDGIPGNRHFYEHVHLRLEGNIVVARALAEAAEQALPHWVRQNKSSAPPLSNEQCAERMAYTPLARFEEVNTIVGGIVEPPFTNQFDNNVTLGSLLAERRSLADWTGGEKLQQALEAQKRVIDGGQSPTRLRALYAACLLKYGGDPREAERVLAPLIANLPPTRYSTYLVRALLAQGRRDEAMKFYELAVADRPWDDQISVETGMAFAESGDFESARAILVKAVRIRPENHLAHNNLGIALAQGGQLEEAILQFKQALQINPDYADARNNLGRAQELLEYETRGHAP